MDKIYYKVVLGHNGKPNKMNLFLLQIETRQGEKRIFHSTHIHLHREQFVNGLIVNHPNMDYLNACVREMVNEMEKIELEYIIRGKYISVSQLKQFYKEKCAPSAMLEDFGESVIKSSGRKDSTKAGYSVLFNNLRRYREDIRIGDIDYTFIVDYEKWMKDEGVCENTRIGRLQKLKTILSEAVKRDVIKENPFSKYKIPSMKNKKGFLSEKNLKDMESLKLKGKEDIIRDAFLFSVYTGLRYSDMRSLKQEEIINGWIKKKMKKTGKTVEIPIERLFDGKAVGIIEKYKGDIGRLGKKMGQCGSSNQILKKIFSKIGVADMGYTYHTSRHTCASLLLKQGLQMSTIQKILGHTKISTTEIYAEVTHDVILNDIKKSIKSKR